MTTIRPRHPAELDAGVALMADVHRSACSITRPPTERDHAMISRPTEGADACDGQEWRSRSARPRLVCC
jgi:hypothetical protein